MLMYIVVLFLISVGLLFVVPTAYVYMWTLPMMFTLVILITVATFFTKPERTFDFDPLYHNWVKKNEEEAI